MQRSELKILGRDFCDKIEARIYNLKGNRTYEKARLYFLTVR